MKRVVYGILGLLSVGFIAFNALSLYVFGKPETNIRVQSSDGEWADGEVLFKGRDFEGLVFTHELYKLVCNAPSAKIERTTPKPKMYELAHWFNDYSEPKWKIPFQEVHPNLVGKPIYPIVGVEHCMNKGTHKEVLSKAGDNAKKFIAELEKNS
ncbi:hypothetical protein [Saccharophagus degradans]|uniref:Uncharacterized protein n=1 Tax=Saccharophagus degradans (strain 2-40 / ATCC 43961 / DSM 17024) TaxID=203122 RepID=Q21I93_SACD2|nr:hypothetical protein [Saccharophagus degradans]ABD81586.1 hypothetical protein Sde_2326 [Saccharophagus degradans 2-40]